METIKVLMADKSLFDVGLKKKKVSDRTNEVLDGNFQAWRRKCDEILQATPYPVNSTEFDPVCFYNITMTQV